MLRSAAAGTAGVPLAGVASADERLPDDSPPGPEVTVLGFDCDPDREEHYTEVSREPTHDFGEELTVELDGEGDGEKIQIGVRKPELEDGETAPVVLRATTYISDLRGYSVRDCTRTRRLAENYVPQGYAVAAVAVRGTGGCMELFGPNEQADVDQAVTWLGTREWSNGNVANIGRSHDGSTTWMAARLGNPHLATVVPLCGVPDVHEHVYKWGRRRRAATPSCRGRTTPSPRRNTRRARGRGWRRTFRGRSARTTTPQGTLWSSYSAATGERDTGGYWTGRVL